MVVPAAVKQAEADADAALAELEKENEDMAVQTTPLDEIVDGGEAPEDSVETEEPVVPLVVDDDLEAPAAPQPIAPAVPVEQGVDYKQKYSTLSGKYNAEIPRLQAEAEMLRSQMAELLAAKAATPEVPKGPAHERYLKENEVSEYGEEILDMQARMAKGVAESVAEAIARDTVTPLQQRIALLEAQVENSSADTYWTKVEKIVPDAQQINQDPLWYDFLDGVDATSGLTYREIGESAYAAGDVARTVNLFQTYMKASGVPEKPTVKKGTPPVKPGVNGKAPVKTKATAKPLISEADATQFYNDVAQGKYRGRDEARKKREAEIDSAAFSGRLV